MGKILCVNSQGFNFVMKGDKMSENTNEIIENKKSLGSSTIFVMIVLALGVFMTAMDAYIFVPALPTIIADLQTSLNWATWTLTTYMLFMTAIMALAGKLSDVFGRKKLYIIGVTTFVIGSITASLSWDIYSLIASMGLQGIGAGIVPWPGAVPWLKLKVWSHRLP